MLSSRLRCFLVEYDSFLVLWEASSGYSANHGASIGDRERHRGCHYEESAMYAGLHVGGIALIICAEPACNAAAGSGTESL